MHVLKSIGQLARVGLIFFLLAGVSLADQDKQVEKAAEKPEGPPPKLVEVARVQKGEVEPLMEFVGTAYYARVSNVAAEVEGLVNQVRIEEGERVKKGELLVELDSDILDTAIAGTRANYGQVLVELEQAEKELRRVAPLYREESLAEVVYDEHYYKRNSLDKKASALKASLDQLLLTKKKKKILAPFDGIVMEKAVEKGEWVSEGGTVAVIADDGWIDVIVEIPAELLGFLSRGRPVDIMSGGKKLSGKYVNFIPKGDVATRTFAIKLRLENNADLVEGMEARAQVPAGQSRESFLVPRDAVVTKFGNEAIFLVDDSKAKMTPVTITGYNGMMAGVAGPGLADGQQVVIKGNERLFGGETLIVQQ